MTESWSAYRGTLIPVQFGLMAGVPPDKLVDSGGGLEVPINQPPHDVQYLSGGSGHGHHSFHANPILSTNASIIRLPGLTFFRGWVLSSSCGYKDS